MRVLVVDDDQGLRRSLSLILGDAGHEVIQATNGIEGLAAAEEHPTESASARLAARRQRSLAQLSKVGSVPAERQTPRTLLDSMKLTSSMTSSHVVRRNPPFPRACW